MRVSRRQVLCGALAIPLSAGDGAAAGVPESPTPVAADTAPQDDGSPDLDTLVASMAFSPDGRMLATGGKKLRLWDVATGSLRKIFEEGDGSVTSVAFSPDMRFVLCGSGNAATVRLQDVVHDKLAWRSEPGPVATLAFSHDGRFALSGGLPFSFKQWDVATGRLVADFDGHTDAVGDLAFSPDDRRIASGSADGTLKLWDAATGQTLASWPVGGAASNLSFGPSGRSITFTFPDDGHPVARIDVATGKVERLLNIPMPANTLTRGSALSVERQLFAVAYDDRIEIWSLSTGKPLRVIRTRGTYLDPLALSPDGKFIAKGTEKNTIALWNVETGKSVTSMRG